MSNKSLILKDLATGIILHFSYLVLFNIKLTASSTSNKNLVISSPYNCKVAPLLIKSQINGIIEPVELVTLPYIAVVNLTSDSLMMKLSPATYFN